MTAAPLDLEKLFNKIRTLAIHTPQGVSGQLSKESSFVFNYHPVADASAVSLVMPVRQQSYSSGELMGVFGMNRPEGYLRYIIEERLKRLGAPSDMFLLFLAGSNQIGRLTYALSGESVPDSPGENLQDLLSAPSGVLFKRLVAQYALGSGISGVQPKTLVPWADDDPLTAHTAVPLKSLIVKAEGNDYPGLARNEFFCLSVAKEAGLDVPPFWLSEDGQLFWMARFDRQHDGTPLGFEDMAVLTGRTEKQKYQGSYEMIARAVAQFTGEDSATELRQLFARVALSCWLRDGDAHLKNFGLLYAHPAAPRQLAPVYDVVCTDIYPELDGLLALKLNGRKNFPNRADLLNYGKRLGLSHLEGSRVLERLAAAYHRVLSHCQQDSRYQCDDLLVRLQQAIEENIPT